MIKSDEGLMQSVECMVDMYSALVELHRRVAPQNFHNYLVLAEGPVDEINRLRRDIHAYLGVTELAAKPPLDEVYPNLPMGEIGEQTAGSPQAVTQSRAAT